jgi:hypothetical protein
MRLSLQRTDTRLWLPSFTAAADPDTGEKKPAGWTFLTDEGWRGLGGEEDEEEDDVRAGGRRWGGVGRSMGALVPRRALTHRILTALLPPLLHAARLELCCGCRRTRSPSSRAAATMTMMTTTTMTTRTLTTWSTRTMT